jgi:hypothetical protein
MLGSRPDLLSNPKQYDEVYLQLVCLFVFFVVLQ